METGNGEQVHTLTPVATSSSTGTAASTPTTVAHASTVVSPALAKSGRTRGRHPTGVVMGVYSTTYGFAAVATRTAVASIGATATSLHGVLPRVAFARTPHRLSLMAPRGGEMESDDGCSLPEIVGVGGVR